MLRVITGVSRRKERFEIFVYLFIFQKGYFLGGERRR
jgi:hypothetical protein